MRIKDFLEKYKDIIGDYSVKIDEYTDVNIILDEFIQAIKNKKIYLYGAGTIGRNYIRLFRQLNLKIIDVFDRNALTVNKIGDFKIKSIEQMIEINDNNSVLIVSVNREHFNEIEKEVSEYINSNIEIVNGHDLHMVIQSAYCLTQAKNGNQLQLKECYECTNLDNVCLSLNYYMKKINGYNEKISFGTKNVKMIGVILGNICTLKCKNCCESVPYMNSLEKGFVEKEQVLKDVFHLSSACEYLSLIEFIGGEPFLHPALGEIMSEVLKINNIGMIHIFTNGTVVPSDELCKILSNERITIYISNYQVSVEGKLKENISKTAEKFEKFGVLFFFGKKTSWFDFRTYDYMSKSYETLTKGFEQCFLHNCNRIYKGDLYICPHQYAVINLGKLDKKNIVPIHNYSKEELVGELDKFKQYDYIDACRFCKMPYDAETVLSGEQI